MFIGFPRTLEQAKTFNQIVQNQEIFNYKLIVLYFKMNDDKKVLSRAPKFRKLPSSINSNDDLFKDRTCGLT